MFKSDFLAVMQQKLGYCLPKLNPLGIALPKSPPLIVQPSRDTLVMTSAGSTFNRGDFTNDAFFWSSLNLSPYAGTLGHTSHKIILKDSTSRWASGYLAGIGAGETLGSEVILNGTNWTGASGVTPPNDWTDSSAGAGNYDIDTGTLKLTCVTNNASIRQTSSVVANQLLKLSIDLKNFNIGNGVYLIVGTSLAGGQYFVAQETGLVFVTHSKYINPTQVNLYNQLETNATNVNQYGWADNYSIKRVTDPPSTAVHIVSSLNGTTRNWASIESGFDPNTISSWSIYGI